MDGEALVVYLRRLGERDSGLRAALARSLAFAPGSYPPAYPALEALVGQLGERERRRAYLIAGLWARYGRRMEGRTVSLAEALCSLPRRTESVQSRFVALLDADEDELPHRLRQSIALVAGSGQSIDWASLYRDLQWWGHPDRYVQQDWARQFFGKSSDAELETADAAAASQA